MIPMPPRSTRNYTLVPYSTLFLSQITHQRPEDRVIAVEIGIESPQRDARAARDRADRAVVETLLAELRRRRIEQRAQRAATALGPRRLADARGGIGRPRGDCMEKTGSASCRESGCREV